MSSRLFHTSAGEAENDQKPLRSFLLIPISLIGALLLASPVLRGSMQWQVQIVASIVGCVALLFAASLPSVRIPVWVSGLLVAVVVTGLQLIPLHPRVLEWLSPNAARLMETSLRELGLFPAFRPLSLDPAATALELAKAALCVVVLITTVILCQSRRAKRFLVSALALAGAIVAVTAVLHALWVGESVVASRVPIVNANHAAGLLNLSAWAALGLALDSDPSRRGAWLACFTAAGSGVWLTASRGGIASFVIGAVFFVAMYLNSARGDRSQRLRWGVLVAASIAVAAGIGVFLGYERLITRFGAVPFHNMGTVDKIAIWPVLARMIGRFPLAGIGRGAFATTYPAFKVNADRLTWTHAENEWLQSLLELGIPCGLLLIGAISWAWLRGLVKNPRCPLLHLGLLTGTAAVAIQNTVDFSLETLGVAIPFVTALGLLEHASPSERPKTVALRIFAAACLVISLGGIVLHQAHSAEAEGSRVAKALVPEEAAISARKAAWWHPADYFIHAAAGASFVQSSRCPEALPWLLRSMALNPTTPEPHLLAGRCFARVGQDRSALREYRLAYVLGQVNALPQALSDYPRVDQALQVVADSPRGLGELGSLLEEQLRFADARIVFERAWNEYHDLDVLARLSEVTLELGNPEESLLLAQQLRQRDPQNVTSYILASAALARLRDPDAAVAQLAEGEAQHPGDSGILLRHAQLLIQRKHFAEARRLLRRALPRNPQDDSRIHLLLSKTLHAEGRLREAIAEASAARDGNPSRPELHLAVADLLADGGLFSEALLAVQKAASLPGVPPNAYQMKIAELASRRAQQESDEKSQAEQPPQ